MSIIIKQKESFVLSALAGQILWSPGGKDQSFMASHFLHGDDGGLGMTMT